MLVLKTNVSTLFNNTILKTFFQNSSIYICIPQFPNSVHLGFIDKIITDNLLVYNFITK